MKILLVCHVEPGTCRDREIIWGPKYEEGIGMAVSRIAEFVDEQDVPLTFAMTPCALKKNETDLSGHHVGVHLHPQDETLMAMLRGVKLVHDCLSRYQERDQAALIDAAKEVFEQVQGQPPRTFVAGNWSESSITLRLLQTAGFLYDASPLPQYLTECADWSRIPRLAQPYHPDAGDYQRRGAMSYLYIPVFQGLWHNNLSPENIHHLGASYFVAAFREARVGGAGVVHIYFHSPMAVDPYFLSEFLPAIDYARDRLGAQFVDPSSVRASPQAVSRPFPPAYFAHMNRKLLRSFFGRGEFGARLLGRV